MSHPAYTLLIGSRNFSSWSLRAWLALKHTGVPFQTRLFDLRGPGRADIKGATPAGLVPTLEVTRPGQPMFPICDSLAIDEFLAEHHPSAGLWPSDPFARARARSVAAEMHSGFVDLRRTCPMDMIARVADHPITEETRANVARITQIWRDCRETFGKGGDFLFGAFGIADCFYAPVVSRFITYDIEVDATALAYCEAVFATPAMREWIKGAETEEAERARNA